MGEHKSYDELRELLRLASEKVVIGGLYVHFKDVESRYVVDELVINEADDTVTVIYHSSADNSVKFARSLSSWLEVIDGVQRFIEAGGLVN